jgi:hypothetical protein
LAYLTLLASVSYEQIEAIRSAPEFTLTPSLIGHASHLLSYWVQEQPLGSILAEIIDGGDLLRSDFWHPLRSPMVHNPESVSTLFKACDESWKAVRDSIADNDWLAFEIARMSAVLLDAATLRNCVVTALDRPGDRKRADRVRLPWEPPLRLGPTKRWWIW